MTESLPSPNNLLHASADPSGEDNANGEARQGSQVATGARTSGALPPGGPSSSSHDAAWWESEAAMHKDRAERMERGMAEQQAEARRFEALATLLAAVALRAGVKPKNAHERVALEWAEQQPHVQIQIRMAA